MSSHPVRNKITTHDISQFTKDVKEISFLDNYEISVRKKAEPGKQEKQLTI
jgi:hypothetical protein